MDWISLNLHFSTAEWFFHGLVFVVNIVLFLAAKPIVTWVSGGAESFAKISIFKAINVLLLVLHGLDVLLVGTYPEYERYFVRIGLSLVFVYLSLLLFGLFTQFARRRFGSKKEVDGNVIYYDSYNSRLIEIIILIVIIFLTVYCLVKVWNADSLLETTGIFGILAAFLAFTSGTWAPDIISGLLILNSQMLEDGDVIVIDGCPDEYIINRVSFMYTILFDIRDNHRTLIRNHRFTQTKIDNFSKVASSDGIRQKLAYKIGYPAIADNTEEARLAAHKSFTKSVDAMFAKAQEICSLDSELKINCQKEFEWLMTNADNYALEYTLWFYLVRVPNTKITATARKHLVAATYKVNEAVYEASVAQGLELSTPDLVKTTFFSDMPTVNERKNPGVGIT